MKNIIRFFIRGWTRANILALLSLIVGITTIFLNSNSKDAHFDNANQQSIQNTCGDATITTKGNNSDIACGNLQINNIR